MPADSQTARLPLLRTPVPSQLHMPCHSPQVWVARRRGNTQAHEHAARGAPGHGHCYLCCVSEGKGLAGATLALVLNWAHVVGAASQPRVAHARAMQAERDAATLRVAVDVTPERCRTSAKALLDEANRTRCVGQEYRRHATTGTRCVGQSSSHQGKPAYKVRGVDLHQWGQLQYMILHGENVVWLVSPCVLLPALRVAV
ncbi:hypothetical protein HaLaN_27332 [Haematococcus lacustris]|uniref:Uncharacterized protein n=1 Tax=Haematococcus lacustris TaxID=44745 RepID=A0A6A0A863_HAELA|nr:hypothetical protein HaLaN_27332 [Haematococcus lacustris]